MRWFIPAEYRAYIAFRSWDPRTNQVRDFDHDGEVSLYWALSTEAVQKRLDSGKWLELKSPAGILFAG